MHRFIIHSKNISSLKRPRGECKTRGEQKEVKLRTPFLRENPTQGGGRRIYLFYLRNLFTAFQALQLPKKSMQHKNSKCRH